MAAGHIENLRQWWLYSLSVTDRTNIVCFIITMIISLIVILAIIKLKLPIWKIQIGLVLFEDFIGVLLLISRLTSG